MAGRKRRTSKGVFVTDTKTSARMARVRQTGTAPELIVRQVCRELGIRYSVANRSLFGSPDLANREQKWAIFIHGCFWHRHNNCAKATTPKRNARAWLAKFERNTVRDCIVRKELQTRGFRVITIWECEAASALKIAKKLAILRAIAR